jgi:hypothetical protein
MRAGSRMLVLTCVGLLTLQSSGGASGAAGPPPDQPPRQGVFATGLDNPRGLVFGPDGQLYVAEAGSGGTESTGDRCPDLQVGPPFGPYVNGPTARVSRLDRKGRRSTVVDGLPSGQSQAPDWQGVADVAFIGRRLFALVQGGGCSYGAKRFPKSVIEIEPPGPGKEGGRYRVVADLGAFRRANPSSVPDDDLETEGVFYSMTSAFGRLYLLDANTGALVEVTTDGRIRTVVDFAATFGHVTPTAITSFGPVLVIGNIFQFPIVDGASTIYAASPFGSAWPVVSGLTAVVDVAFDRHGRLYALEMGNGQGSGFPDPEAGRVVRVSLRGDHEVIATGLTFPTAMTFGPDGRLYVSNRGFDIPPTGTGEIVVIEVR